MKASQWSRWTRAGGILLTCLGTLALAEYGLEAWRRTTATECIAVISHNGLYRAESCVSGGSGNLIRFVGRLYETANGKLVGKTSFDSTDGGAPKFTYDDGAVLFQGAQGDAGMIDIPPTLSERLRAKLP